MLELLCRDLIAENDPSIIEKNSWDLQNTSLPIMNSYDTMIDMFIKMNRHGR